MRKEQKCNTKEQKALKIWRKKKADINCWQAEPRVRKWTKANNSETLYRRVKIHSTRKDKHVAKSQWRQEKIRVCELAKTKPSCLSRRSDLAEGAHLFGVTFCCWLRGCRAYHRTYVARAKVTEIYVHVNNAFICREETGLWVLYFMSDASSC